MVSKHGRSVFGSLLRHHRHQRGLSQLALALRAETTTRHVSYVENGRSRPGRDLVLRLAEALDLPLRSRNELLTAAGFATEFTTHPLASPALAPYRRAIIDLIGALDPFPAFVVDSLFNLQETNVSGRRMMPAIASGAHTNLIDAFLAPGPARAQIANFAEIAWSWRARFSRATASLPRTAELADLEQRLASYVGGVPRPTAHAGDELVLCPTFRVGDHTIRTIGMTMRFGPSRDVTLEELFVDVLSPRDDEAKRFFRELSKMPERDDQGA